MGRSSSSEIHKDSTKRRYPRLRALTACTTCRQKKSKCDNSRPICGGCQIIKKTNPEKFSGCHFDTSAKNDLSSFDASTLAVIDKIDTLQKLIIKSVKPNRSYGPVAADVSNVVVPELNSHWNFNPEYFLTLIGTLENYSDFNTKKVLALLHSQVQLQPKDLRIDSSAFESHMFQYLDHYVAQFFERVYPQAPYIEPGKLKATANYLKRLKQTCVSVFDTELTMPAQLLPLPVMIQCIVVAIQCGSAPSSLIDYSSTQLADIGFYISHTLRVNEELSLSLTSLVNGVQYHLLTCIYYLCSSEILNGFRHLQRACSELLICCETNDTPFSLVDIKPENDILIELYNQCVKLEMQLRIHLAPIEIPFSMLAYKNSVRISSGNFYNKDHVIDSTRYAQIHIIHTLEFTLAKSVMPIVKAFFVDDSSSWVVNFDLPQLREKVQNFLNSIDELISLIESDEITQMLDTDKRDDDEATQKLNMPIFVAEVKWQVAMLKLVLRVPILYYALYHKIFDNDIVKTAVSDVIKLMHSLPLYLVNTIDYRVWFRVRHIYFVIMLMELLEHRFGVTGIASQGARVQEMNRLLKDWNNRSGAFEISLDNIAKLKKVLTSES